MPWRIVVQPNLRYARFSTVVDGFTHTDMTREEALEVCRGYPGFGVLEAEEKVAAGEREPERFKESLVDIEIRFGREERDKIERALTATLSSG